MLWEWVNIRGRSLAIDGELFIYLQSLSRAGIFDFIVQTTAAPPGEVLVIQSVGR